MPFSELVDETKFPTEATLAFKAIKAKIRNEVSTYSPECGHPFRLKVSH